MQQKRKVYIVIFEWNDEKMKAFSNLKIAVKYLNSFERKSKLEKTSYSKVYRRIENERLKFWYKEYHDGIVAIKQFPIITNLKQLKK